ncbi:MAG TPA: alpha/beta fold hydrolase [Methylibium sp.]|uniref:alpha/beta fold hydrolase n=1 Tax=Methylibium sp. TaxID=2067992 RepID=UPI002DB96D71|nr:alpha/beta fold hydrolase [Methylibium sp.]HEU4458481.1 alpha/beta fold hydrolase [Methylibium sp.]
MDRQQLRFCTAPDGVRIAVATIGRGAPLLRAAHWLTHVEHDHASPVWRPWLDALSKHHTYIRYDQRGCGLSDREVADYSLPSWVGDLSAVIDALQLPRVPILGMSQGGAVAIAYAVAHPERVSHLVLAGAYARGSLRRDPSPAQQLEAHTLVNLIRVGWGSDNPAFREVFTRRFIKHGTPEQLQWWTELMRITSSADAAARLLEAFHQVDVTELARQVRVPTLVLHARGDAAVPFEEGRLLASLIPGARFVTLDTDNHVLLSTEPAWGHFLAEVGDFLGAPPPTAADDGLTPAEREVLTRVARGLDNRAIAAELGKSEKTVRNQVSSILDKLGLHSRAEAIVHVRDRGAHR